MPGVRERRVVASLLTYWAGRRAIQGEIYFSEEKYMKRSGAALNEHKLGINGKQKKKTKKSKRKRGGQKGHKGHKQQMLDPSQTKNVFPDSCDCGRMVLEPDSIKPFYTHQHIELPKIKLDVVHLILNQGKCRCCGKTVKAKIPSHLRRGYGPRLSAVICELSGSHGASRQTRGCISNWLRFRQLKAEGK